MRTGRRTDGQIGRHKYAPTIIQTSFAVGNIGEHIEICYVREKLKNKIEKKKITNTNKSLWTPTQVARGSILNLHLKSIGNAEYKHLRSSTTQSDLQRNSTNNDNNTVVFNIDRSEHKL